MAAPFYWLDDESSTYALDSNAYNINLGTPKRRYSLKEYVGAHGGYIQGTGLYETREIRIDVRFTNVGGNNTWTTTRNNLWNWINKAKHETLWLYIKHNDDSTETRVRVYPTPSGSEIYDFINVSKEFGIRFLCEKPYFQNTTASTGSETVTDSSEHTFSINNTGKLETSCQFKFTPTADATSFQVEIANNYGFTLEKVSFPAGSQIVYDTANGALTIGGVSYNARQYLTSGSIFNLPIGTNSVYVTCSGAGTFAYTFYTRWI